MVGAYWAILWRSKSRNVRFNRRLGGVPSARTRAWVVEILQTVCVAELYALFVSLLFCRAMLFRLPVLFG